MSNYSDSSFSEKNANTSWYKVFNMIESGKKVLDIGCSSGNFGKELIVRKNCIVDGIEISDEDYVSAKKKLRKVYKLNIETDELSNIEDKYDYIYFGDVIEHLVDPVSALSKIKNLLEDGGRLVFSIPNMANISIRISLLGGEFEYTETGLLDKTHLHFYTQAEVFRVLESAGYSIDIMDYVTHGYTSKYLDSILRSVGLKGSEKFYNFCKTPSASAFQFVGSAVIANSKTRIKKLRKNRPINDLDSYYDNWQKETEAFYKNQIKEKDLLIQSLNSELHEAKKNIIKKASAVLRKYLEKIGAIYRKG